MENASKALLIAAGVLIVILLIAFGMRVFNSTTGAEEQMQGVADEIGGAIDEATGVIQHGKVVKDNAKWTNFIKTESEMSNLTIEDWESLINWIIETNQENIEISLDSNIGGGNFKSLNAIKSSMSYKINPERGQGNKYKIEKKISGEKYKLFIKKM